MKSLITTIALIAVLGLFTFIDPKMDDYKEFIESKVSQMVAAEYPRLRYCITRIKAAKADSTGRRNTVLLNRF